KVLGCDETAAASTPSRPTAVPRPPSATAVHASPPAKAADAKATIAQAIDKVAVATGAEEPVVENAETLSTIECGAQEVKERLDAGEPVTMLDVREPSETAGGVIPGAIRIPLGQLRARWEEVKDANEIVCYCAMGARSLQAAHFLREQGLFNATSLDGGISAWMEIGGKVVRP
ncbi:MAG: rhodanese-like domain-containing protein, partial [Myxococcota bacterium]